MPIPAEFVGAEATITGTTRLPSGGAPLEGTWYVQIRTLNGAAIDSDGGIRAGDETVYDDGTGAAMALPAGIYRAKFVSSGLAADGHQVVLGPYGFDLTTDTTWGDIMETPVEVPVTPSDVARAEAAADRAQDAADDAEAAGLGATQTVTTAGTAQTLIRGFNFLTLTSSTCALTMPASPFPGAEAFLQVKQGATGSRLVTFTDTIKWPFDVAPVLQTAVGAIDQMVFQHDGSNWRGKLTGSFSS